ncbi:hypothetical protein EPN42_15395 [bacterium]|nr:MAG: hypothetical protein EPN42_15395 [bacterium]
MIPMLPPGFTATVIAHVDGARELAVAPNGDLFVGTGGEDVYVVERAEAPVPATARVFVHIADAPVAGVLLAGGALYAGGQFHVWRIPYRTGDRKPEAAPQAIAHVRTSGRARDHDTTSLAFSEGVLYASVGSSCNNCMPELDDTRATVQAMAPNGHGMHPAAVRIRNAIALATDPATGNVWAGVAGQDELERGHPYEIFDPITAHRPPADYGWPACVENRKPVRAGFDCGQVVVPRVVFPAYITPIGAVFYTPAPAALHPFPREWSGGAFVTLHGSWHQPLVAPLVAYVPMLRDEPLRAVSWTDPLLQWRTFAGGFQDANGIRGARPTGIAEGPEGDLFLSDDQSGTIWRIRHTGLS